MIPFNKPFMGSLSEDAAAEVLRGGIFQGGGAFTKLSEGVIRDISKLNNIMLTASCTQALEMAANLIFLQSEDEVIMPSFNFTSAAISTVSAGATPVFVDIDPGTKNISVEGILSAINKRTKAISLVNYAGVACDFDQILAISRDHNLFVVEDNAHGFGAQLHGKPLGGFGDLSCHSFHETKNIHCGEGGFIAINSPELIELANIARDKGTNRKQFFEGFADKYTWQGRGGSYQLGEILAAILYGQLNEYQEIQKSRLSVWESYFLSLTQWAHKNDIKLPYVPEGNTNIAHIFYLEMPTEKIRIDFIGHMERKGVDVRFHFQALDTSPGGRKYGKTPFACPVSQKVASTLIRLPLWYGMPEADVCRIIDACVDFKLN